jgi:hypothetical protein
VMVRMLVACSKMQLPNFVLSSAMADSTTWYMMETCWCYSLTLVSVEDLGLCDINCTTLAWGTVPIQCLQGHIICHGLTGYVSQWVACCLYVMMLSWYRRWQFESLLLWKLEIVFILLLKECMKNIPSKSRVAGYRMVWDILHHPMYFVCLLLMNKWQLKLTVKILSMF